jgi:hypothetical protein
MLCPSYYGLYSLFNKISDKGRQFLSGREGVWMVREGVGAWGRNDPSLVCTYE